MLEMHSKRPRFQNYFFLAPVSPFSTLASVSFFLLCLLQSFCQLIKNFIENPEKIIDLAFKSTEWPKSTGYENKYDDHEQEKALTFYEISSLNHSLQSFHYRILVAGERCNITGDYFERGSTSE